MTAAVLVLAVVALLCPLARAQPLPTSNQDAVTLMSFKALFTNGATVLQSWAGAEQDPCTSGWLGVGCQEVIGVNRVTELNLAGQGLQGDIPPAGWPLPDSLQILDLWVNDISGTFPDYWPLNAPSLQAFKLGYGEPRISGPLPRTWQLPASLKVLWIGSTDLSGTIPADWALPPTLEELSFALNAGMGGSIPSNWILPPSLTLLHLDGNQLTGTLPTDWVLPANLTKLYMAGNFLSGPIPTDWPLPSGLKELMLYQNQLNGTIPGTWPFPPLMTNLSLIYNELTGTIPEELILPSTLTEFLVDANKLVGTIPEAFALNLPASLKILGLSLNTLSGTIPTNFVLPDLYFMYLNDNMLTGSLPAMITRTEAHVNVLPQNSMGFCGTLPEAPQYFIWRGTDEAGNPLPDEQITNDTLPPCPGGVPGPTPPTSPPSPSPTLLSPSPVLPSPSPSPVLPSPSTAVNPSPSPSPPPFLPSPSPSPVVTPPVPPPACVSSSSGARLVYTGDVTLYKTPCTTGPKAGTISRCDIFMVTGKKMSSTCGESICFVEVSAFGARYWIPDAGISKPGDSRCKAW